MTLTTEQQILVEQRVANDAKSTGIAYILWFFLGGLGGHRFYLGRAGTGAIMAALLVLGFLTSAIGIGFVLLAILGIWALVDAFLIPGMVTALKTESRARIAQEVGATAN